MSNHRDIKVKGQPKEKEQVHQHSIKRDINSNTHHHHHTSSIIPSKFTQADAYHERSLATLQAKSTLNTSNTITSVTSTDESLLRSQKQHQGCQKSSNTSLINLHTNFRKVYDQKELPLRTSYEGNTRIIQWNVKPNDVNLEHVVPLLFDGLLEVADPYQFLAREGLRSLIRTRPVDFHEIIPFLVFNFRAALISKYRSTVVSTLIILLEICCYTVYGCKTLLYYGRYILPHLDRCRINHIDIINLNTTTATMITEESQKQQLIPEATSDDKHKIMGKNRSKVVLSTQIEYGTRESLKSLIQDVLYAFECHGGEAAYQMIKKFIPGYHSQFHLKYPR